MSEDIPGRPSGGNGNNSFTRKIADSGAKYIGRGIQTFNDTYKVNNLYRSKYVLLKLTDDLRHPTTEDNTTQVRLRDLHKRGLYGQSIYRHATAAAVETVSSAYYGAIKYDIQNQYGQVHSITQIPVGSCIAYPENIGVYSSMRNENNLEKPNVIFGGDVYINRYTEKNPYMFFHTWLHDVPDETEMDYRNYINGPLPRYWANLDKFDVDDFEINPEDVDGASPSGGATVDVDDLEDELGLGLE